MRPVTTGSGVGSSAQPREEESGSASEMTLALVRHAKQRPDDVAVRDVDGLGHLRATSWGQLRDGAVVLRDSVGHSAGRTVVMVVSSNCVELQVALLGALWAGADVLPVSPASTRAELLALASSTGASVLIGDENARSALEGRVSRIIAVESLLEIKPRGEAVPNTVRPGSILLQSSGTTGKPRTVRREQHALDAVGRNVCRALRLNELDRMLLTIPLYHSYGVDLGVLSATIAGCEVKLHPRFVPGLVISALLQDEVSVWPAVPVMLNAVSGSTEPRRLRRLRRVVSAGSRLPPRVSAQFSRTYGVDVGQIYGASEFGSVSFNDPDDHDFDPESVGRPLCGVEIRIVDQGDHRGERPLPVGSEGEVLVSAPSMMTAYTDARAGGGVAGFLRTGDIGRLDEHGRLTLTGRIRLLIDVGAQKVNPLEVEERLAQHPTVAEAVVIPISFSDTADRLKAIIVPVVSREVDVAELRRFAQEHLSAHKVPRVFAVRADVPRSPTGKILRRQLLEEERISRGSSGEEGP